MEEPEAVAVGTVEMVPPVAVVVGMEEPEAVVAGVEEPEVMATKLADNNR
jgi:hypothetical protein